MDLRGKRSSYRNVVFAIYLSLRLKGPHISEMRNKEGKLTTCLIYALFFSNRGPHKLVLVEVWGTVTHFLVSLSSEILLRHLICFKLFDRSANVDKESLLVLRQLLRRISTLLARKRALIYLCERSGKSQDENFQEIRWRERVGKNLTINMCFFDVG